MVEKVTKTLEIIKGELTHKEEKLSSNKRTYWPLEISGLGKAGVWDKEIADILHVGKVYEFAYETDGKFNNIQSVKEVATTEPPKAVTPPAEHGPTYIPQPKNDQAIMAQVALKSAVLRANGIVGRELLTREVIAIGQEYFKAMQLWAKGIFIPIDAPKQPATAPVAAKVENTTETEKGPLEGIQGAKVSDKATEAQKNEILRLGKLVGYRDDNQVIVAVCGKNKRDEWKDVLAGEAAQFITYLKDVAVKQGKKQSDIDFERI